MISCSQVKYKKHKRNSSSKHSMSSPSTPMSLPPPPSPIMSTPGMSPGMNNPMSPSPSSGMDLHCMSSSSALTTTTLKYELTSSHQHHQMQQQHQQQQQQPHSPVDISHYSRTSPNKSLLPSGINILRAALTGSPDVSILITDSASHPSNDEGFFLGTFKT